MVTLPRPEHTGPKTWFLLFFDGGRRPWFMRWLKPRFSHVMALGFDAAHDTWMLADYRPVGLCIHPIGDRVADGLLAFAMMEGAVLKCAVREGFSLRPWAPLYCVTLMRALLNERGLWAVTPWQLYGALRRRGAQPIVMPEKPEQEDRHDGLHVPVPAQAAAAGPGAGTPAA